MPISILPSRHSKIGALTIEATLSESHSMTSTVTKFPVEDGVATDHIVNDPVKVSLDCFISNTPLNGQDPANFAQEAFDLLTQMWETRELITVVTQFKVYVDMAITDITVPRNARTGDAINFTVDLMKIKKVQATTVTVYQNTLSEEVVDQATSTINTGAVTPGPANSTQINLATTKLLDYKAGTA